MSLTTIIIFLFFTISSLSTFAKNKDFTVTNSEQNVIYGQANAGTIGGVSIKRKCEKLEMSLNKSKKIIYRDLTDIGFDCKVFKDSVVCAKGNQFTTTNYFNSRYLCEKSYDASDFKSE